MRWGETVLFRGCLVVSTGNARSLGAPATFTLPVQRHRRKEIDAHARIRDMEFYCSEDRVKNTNCEIGLPQALVAGLCMKNLSPASNQPWL